jgi:hypothetical protein
MGFVLGSIGHQNLLAGYGLTAAEGEHLVQFTDVPTLIMTPIFPA